ncbi:MAG: type IX secretion system protein PorQ [Bacteroidota bacterium]|nr:type IX secretion system protein PorQ [Bacteroidota bacterium]
MIKSLKVLVLLFILSAEIGFAQTGGQGVYKFLNLSTSARVSALGGNVVSVYDDDLNMSFYNPSLLNEQSDGTVILNYVNYFAGLNYGYAAYSFHTNKFGSFSAGIHYLNYGEFIAADENGTITGTFGASDYALNLIWAKPVYKNVNVGVNLKPVYSHLEKYSSLGLVSDIGLSYTKTESNFSMALVLRNLGFQLTPYYNENREGVEPDLTAGISQKLAHAPFRLSLTLHHLTRWDLSYEEESQSLSIYDEPVDDQGFDVQKHLDDALRHVNVGIEFLPMKNFYIAVGYNYLRRAEMGIKDYAGFTGLSWGFGLKLKRMGISYGRASYHVSGGSNHFSVYYRVKNAGNEQKQLPD